MKNGPGYGKTRDPSESAFTNNPSAGRILREGTGMRLTYISAMALLAGVAMAMPAAAQTEKVGAAAYVLSPKSPDRGMSPAPGRTDAMMKTAAQTNQWYSALLFNPKPEALYVQPITVKATPAGLEFALPSKEVVPTVRRDVEIKFPHRDPLVISPLAFEPGTAKLARADDWSIDIAMARGSDDMRVTVAHGSPYASFQLTRGDVRVRLPSAVSSTMRSKCFTALAASPTRL